ncbi:hypothetical protein ACP70R_036832 [Stipagrostis hirtigluma subsp. patula]
MESPPQPAHGKGLLRRRRRAAMHDGRPKRSPDAGVRINDTAAGSADVKKEVVDLTIDTPDAQVAVVDTKVADQQTTGDTAAQQEPGPSNANGKRVRPADNPKANNFAYISRRMMLQEVMDQLDLKILHTGTDRDAQNLRQGWMHVELPKNYKKDPVQDTTIYGQTSSTAAGAKENAAKAVLDYFCTTKGVKISDWNHHQLRKTNESLQGANFWADTFKEKIDDMARESSAETAEYRRLLRSIATICDSFSDVLPVQKVGHHDPQDNHVGTGFAYTGSNTNPSRLDQLALALLDVLAGGVAHQAKRGVHTIYIAIGGHISVHPSTQNRHQRTGQQALLAPGSLLLLDS